MRMWTTLFAAGAAAELYDALGDPKPWLSLVLTISFVVLANVAARHARWLAPVSRFLHWKNGVRVRDVGKAVAEASNRYLAGYQNNELGILLNVSKQPSANVISTVDQIKTELPRVTANILQP